jgi:soluble lytic murein transglycosylase
MLSRYRDGLRGWSDPVGQALVRLRLRPNHLTIAGLGVSVLAAAAFVTGHVRTGGILLLLAGLFDFFDGSLARASGQVTPFGAFLDSVIDRYSDLIVLLGIVVLFAQMPHMRGAVVAMAGLIGSTMVSYTKARAESIGVRCDIGFMERPERMICLIGGAVLDLLEPALWILAILANLTALHRIVFTRRMARGVEIFPALAAVLLLAAPAAAGPPAWAEREEAWATAVEAYRTGTPDPVIAEFGAAEALGSPIGDYLGYVLADALGRRGDLAAARSAATAVAERHAGSRLAPSALLLAATLASRAGDEAAAQALLVRCVDSYRDSAELPRALYLLGMTAEARGLLDAAAQAYREITVLAPTSGYADGASDRLAALQAASVRVPGLSLDQRLDRAERLLRGGVARTAVDEAERVAKEAADSGIVVRALRLVAEASRRLGQPQVAAGAIELALKRARPEQKAGLQLEHARLLRRAGQRDRALTVLGEVAAGKSVVEASEAAYLRARLLDDMGRQAAAVSAYRTVAAKFPGREVAGEALWRLGWVAYLAGDAKGAEQTWARLLQAPGGRAHRVAALYWMGRAIEQVRGRAAAGRHYRQVLREAPRSYYGVLAAHRTEVLPGENPREPSLRLPPDPGDAVANDPGFARVDLLRRIGLIEFAWQELEDVVQRSVGDPVRLYGFSGTYIRDERYYQGLRILRRHFAGLATTGDAGLPPAFWEMLYPFGWRQAVTEAAERFGLDPSFVAAVVREESSYHPQALSPAGARGLMQLMPATARMVAGSLGLPVGIEHLDDPHMNIQMGTKFLAELVRKIGDPRLALAAYNAGPGRLGQWWSARRTDDVEAFVELIPFDETRRYVKRVMLSWDEYRRIYFR